MAYVGPRPIPLSEPLAARRASMRGPGRKCKRALCSHEWPAGREAGPEPNLLLPMSPCPHPPRAEHGAPAPPEAAWPRRGCWLSSQVNTLGWDPPSPPGSQTAAPIIGRRHRLPLGTADVPGELSSRPEDKPTPAGERRGEGPGFPDGPCLGGKSFRRLTRPRLMQSCFKGCL